MTGSGVNAVFAASPSVEEAVAVDMARRCARACVNDRVITGIDQGVSSLAPGVADLHVACVLTSRLDDMSWSIRHQVYRHRFYTSLRIACRTDKRPHIGR